MAHRLLGHTAPDRLRRVPQQRLEINYFAAALPDAARRRPSPSSQQAKKDRNLAVEDFRDAFGVTHEAAALRFTNLATQPPRHDRCTSSGSTATARCSKALRERRPAAADRRHRLDRGPDRLPASGARARAFDAARTARPSTTSTPTPRRARSGARRRPARTAAGGVLDHRRACRSTTRSGSAAARRTKRASSTCPDEACCRRAPGGARRALGRARRGRAPACTRRCSRRCRRGTFPGVDDAEVYEFLEAHADQ